MAMSDTIQKLTNTQASQATIPPPSSFQQRLQPKVRLVVLVEVLDPGAQLWPTSRHISLGVLGRVGIST